MPPGTPNWHPILKKISPKIDTPFYKWANFLYPVPEFALKLIPCSRNGSIFLYSVLARVQQGYNSLLVDSLNRIFKSNQSLNNFKWLLIQNWSVLRSFRAFGILYPVLAKVSEMDTPF